MGGTRAVRAVAGGAAVLVAAVLAVPAVAAHGHLVLAAAAASAAAVVAVARRRAPGPRWPAVVGALAVLAAAQLLRAAGAPAVVADVALVASQLALFGGYLLLVPGPVGGARRSEVLDAAVVTVSVGVLLLVHAVVPALTAAGPLSARVAAASVPAFDVAVLAVLTRTAAWPGRRSRSSWWLTASAAAVVTGHAAAVALAVAGARPPGWFVGFHVLATAFIALAAVDPSAGALGRRPVLPVTASTHVRLPVLTGAALLPPAAIVAGELGLLPRHALELTVGSLLVLVLVLLRVWTLLALVRDQAEVVARLADTDPLTGLPNRRCWDAEVARCFAAAHLGGGPVTVAIVDLDHFKAYNDARGHDGGDTLLRDAATAWTRALPDAFVARWGGEEFTVLLPGCDAERALVLLDRVHDAVPDGQTCSIGIAQWDRSEVPPATLTRADRALYRAKAGGRDRSELADDAGAPAARTTTLRAVG